MNSPASGGPTVRSSDYVRDRIETLLDESHSLLLALLLGLTALALAGLLAIVLLEPVPPAYVEMRG